MVEVVAVRPRAPLVTRVVPAQVDMDLVTAGPKLRAEAPATPVHVNPLNASGQGAAFQHASKDATNAQANQRRIVGWIAGSLGLAGLGLGATTSVMALSKKDPPPDRQCADPVRMCSPDGKAFSGNSSLSTLGVAGWAIGAVGVATGAVLIFTSNPKTGRETAVGPDIYRKGAGLSVRRNW